MLLLLPLLVAYQTQAQENQIKGNKNKNSIKIANNSSHRQSFFEFFELQISTKFQLYFDSFQRTRFADYTWVFIKFK